MKARLSGLPRRAARRFTGRLRRSLDTHLACTGPPVTDRLALRREASGLTDSVALLLVVARCSDDWKSYPYVSLKRRLRQIAVADGL